MDRKTIGALLFAVVGLSALMFVASSGIVAVWHDPPPGPTSNTPTVVDDAAADDPGEIGGFLLPALPALKNNRFLNAIIVVTLVFFASLAGFVVWAWTRLLVRRRQRDEDMSRSFTSLPRGPTPSVLLDTEAQLAALQHGSARNAIVACWMQLEDDVEAAGILRHPAETAAEFTTRVLAGSSIDAAPVMELAALYREARFSRHELDQADRDRALGALRRVHAALAAGAVDVTCA